MKVSLKQIPENAEEFIVDIARVSSVREDKTAEADRLIRYLIKNKHWSPFEHSSMTIEIETSRAIAAQILRHRSFTFQEFSQRYQDVTKIADDIFEPVELRQKGDTNRQSSLDVFDPRIETGFSTSAGKVKASKEIEELLEHCERVYSSLLKEGVAGECARGILPLATKTRIYMTGTIRSWVHFLALRDDSHAQKEIRMIAKEIKGIFVENLPNVAKALEYEMPKPEEKPEEVMPERKKYTRLSDVQKKALRKDSKKMTIAELATKYKVSYSNARNVCI